MLTQQALNPFPMTTGYRKLPLKSTKPDCAAVECHLQWCWWPAFCIARLHLKASSNCKLHVASCMHSHGCCLRASLAACRSKNRLPATSFYFVFVVVHQNRVRPVWMDGWMDGFRCIYIHSQRNALAGYSYSYLTANVGLYTLCRAFNNFRVDP